MSLSFSDTKIYSKDDWNIVFSKYNIVNQERTQVILPPINNNYTNLKIYCDYKSWKIFTDIMNTTPIQPINITLLNYQNNIITRYPKSRTTNKKEL